jgi:acyl-CoA reductase-like NAD-dependent aldehyde dehydrogenase
VVATDVRSPYDGAVLGKVPALTTEDVDQAVDRAADAMRSPLPAWRRAEILDRAGQLIRERREDLARTIAGEAAKPIKTARIEAERAVSTFTFAAIEARTLTGDMIPIEGSAAGEGKLAFTLRVPVGVIGAISPFNFPLNLVCHKVAPAIAAGCAVVLKPAGQTPLSALALAGILAEAGLPEGWLQVVTGSGQVVGARLVEHPDIAMITFTGSPEVGWGIRAAAARKRVSLELGNNAPLVLEPDGEVERCAQGVSVAAFSHAGQSCISTQRVYVHEDVYDRFAAALVSHVEKLVVGDPMDEATDVSSLISKADRDRVKAWVDEAVAAGATVLTGGTIEDGVLRPTVLGDVTPDMKVCALEVFGPVVGLARYRDYGEALRLAGDSRYGLHAAVWTKDIGKALRAARSLDFGGVIINEVPTWRADQMPYGGVRDSGNTREGPHFAVREMTEERLIVIHG